MNTFKDNYEFYVSTFDEVHASDELLRKVKNMTETKPKKKIYAIRKVLYVAAAVVIMFIVSNAVVYAATGETWFEMVAVNVILNGELQEIEAVKTTDENGNVSYEMNLEEKNGIKQSFIFGDDAEFSNGESIAVETPGAEPTLTEKDGKIFFELPAMDIKEDITDDFADGKASFTINADDKKLVITIEGTIDEYTVDYAEK